MRQRSMLFTPAELGADTIEEARALDDAALLAAARSLDVESELPADDIAVRIDRYGAYDGVAVTVCWTEDV